MCINMCLDKAVLPICHVVTRFDSCSIADTYTLVLIQNDPPEVRQRMGDTVITLFTVSERCRGMQVDACTKK